MRNATTELGSKSPDKAPNPKRVAAGKRNWLKRRGLSAEGREKLRLAALRNEPWQHSTGTRTPAGKATAVINGKKRQDGLVSLRELKADMRVLRAMLRDMKESQQSVGL